MKAYKHIYVISIYRNVRRFNHYKIYLVSVASNATEVAYDAITLQTHLLCEAAFDAVDISEDSWNELERYIFKWNAHLLSKADYIYASIT